MCQKTFRVVWAVRTGPGWLAWRGRDSDVDDRQNGDREERQVGWQLVSFEAQRPIEAVPAGVVGYDVRIRSCVGDLGETATMSRLGEHNDRPRCPDPVADARYCADIVVLLGGTCVCLSVCLSVQSVKPLWCRVFASRIAEQESRTRVLVL